MSDKITVGPEEIKPQLLTSYATGIHWAVTGLDYAQAKIRVRKDDALLLFMQAHGIDYSKVYEVIDDDDL